MKIQTFFASSQQDGCFGTLLRYTRVSSAVTRPNLIYPINLRCVLSTLSFILVIWWFAVAVIQRLITETLSKKTNSLLEVSSSFVVYYGSNGQLNEIESAHHRS